MNAEQARGWGLIDRVLYNRDDAAPSLLGGTTLIPSTAPPIPV
jgi:hypothetical protein